MPLATLSAKISPELITQIDALVGEGQSKSSIVAQLLATALSDRPPSPDDDEPIDTDYPHPALGIDDRLAELNEAIAATAEKLDRLVKCRAALDWKTWQLYFKKPLPETRYRVYSLPAKR